eukprot:748432-Hanusia_phi.AAC.3
MEEAGLSPEMPFDPFFPRRRVSGDAHWIEGRKRPISPRDFDKKMQGSRRAFGTKAEKVDYDSIAKKQQQRPDQLLDFRGLVIALWFEPFTRPVDFRDNFTIASAPSGGLAATGSTV